MFLAFLLLTLGCPAGEVLDGRRCSRRAIVRLTVLLALVLVEALHENPRGGAGSVVRAYGTAVVAVELPLVLLFRALAGVRHEPVVDVELPAEGIWPDLSCAIESLGGDLIDERIQGGAVAATEKILLGCLDFVRCRRAPIGVGLRLQCAAASLFRRPSFALCESSFGEFHDDVGGFVRPAPMCAFP